MTLKGEVIQVRSKKSISETDSRNRIFKAITVANEAHWGQYRPGTNIPYILHPLRAQKILVDYDCSEELQIAAILHDTIEDTNLTVDEITEYFGERVAKLVIAATDEKELPWIDRKKSKLKYFKNEATIDELLVICADKLDNISSIRKNSERVGELFWNSRFKKHSKKELEWYYTSLAKVFITRIAGETSRKLFTEFYKEVEKVFGLTKEKISAT